jgi:hypothetical protein
LASIRQLKTAEAAEADYLNFSVTMFDRNNIHPCLFACKPKKLKPPHPREA